MRLRLELQRRLGRMTGSRPDFTKLTLDIDVQHLEAELGRYALLRRLGVQPHPPRASDPMARGPTTVRFRLTRRSMPAMQE